MLTLFQLGYLTCETAIQLELDGDIDGCIAFDRLAWQTVADAPFDEDHEFAEGHMARCMPG